MTTINPGAEAAREAARDSTGQFGTQEHSAPEAALNVEPTPADILERLSWVHSKDSYQADLRREGLRVASFVEDARQHVPEATSAVFYWDFDESGSRIVFSHYLDADGSYVEDEDGGYPDVNDFAFDDTKEAEANGFTAVSTDDNGDHLLLNFDEIAIPDIDRARAELAVGEKLERDPDSVAIRALLGQALDVGLTPNAVTRVESLTDDDLAALRKVMAEAVDKARLLLNVRADEAAR